MGKYYNKFLGKNIDLAPLGIERREDNSPYFCTPRGASIIGGADGPTAMIVGAPQTNQEFSACSAPHFEPAARIQWYPVLRVTEYEPVRIILK